MTTAAPVTSVVTRCRSPRRCTLTTDTLIQTHFHHQGHTQCTETDLETEDWSIQPTTRDSVGNIQHRDDN